MNTDQKKQNLLKFAGLIVLSTLLSITTVVFGGLPLLPARRVGGRVAFWALQLLIAATFMLVGWPFYGFIVLAQTLLVGVYVEAEQHGSSVFTSGLIAALTSVGTVVLGGGLWLKLTKLQLGDQLRKQIDPLVAQLASTGGKSALTTNAILQQLPSAVVIALILSLGLALIAERNIAAAWKLREYRSGSKEELRGFRTPDFVVWVVVATIAGAFLKHGKPVVELISVNLLNVLVVLYFFQGLAVVSAGFRAFKVSGMWQAIWYVLIILQLFLMVSLVGFADYWLDFRERLARKPAEESNRGF